MKKINLRALKTVIVFKIMYLQLFMLELLLKICDLKLKILNQKVSGISDETEG